VEWISTEEPDSSISGNPSLHLVEPLIPSGVEVSGNPTSCHIVANQEELAKEIMDLTLRSISVHTSKRSFGL
jgi:hypothetical protein